MAVPVPGHGPADSVAWRHCPHCASVQCVSSAVCIDCGARVEPGDGTLSVATAGFGLASLVCVVLLALVAWLG